MKLLGSYCISLVLLLVSNLSSGQRIENTVLKLLCKEIVNENRLYSLKQNLKGVEFVVFVDSVTLEENERVIISNEIDDKQKKFIKQYKKEELIKILKAKNYPIYPLTDTLFIVDTLQFFSKQLTFKHENHYFKVVKSMKTPERHPCIQIYDVGFQSNKLLLAFALNKFESLITYHFAIRSAKLKLAAKRDVALKTTAE